MTSTWEPKMPSPCQDLSAFGLSPTWQVRLLKGFYARHRVIRSFKVYDQCVWASYLRPQAHDLPYLASNGQLC